MDNLKSQTPSYQEPPLGTVEAYLMNTTKPSAIVRVFKHNALRGDTYWVNVEVKTFKTLDQAKAYIDRVTKSSEV